MSLHRLPAVRTLPLLAAIGASCACLPAHAQLKPGAVFVQAGPGEDHLKAVSVGALWPWAWRKQALGGEWSANTEVFLSTWRADAIGGGNRSFLQVGVVPLFRYTLDQGRSPWFGEIGIGLSILDRQFVTPTKTFATRWNFSDNLAVGRSFGDKGQHEVSLRWQHSSNGGAKHPNPGIDIGLVRYTMRF
jgi:lipid A 3-O-deacylase